MKALQPSVTLLVKLGSIAVHAEEMTEPGAHHFDEIALKQLLADAEVQEWRKEMDAAAMLPVKRSVPAR
jgi:hypothetical protein